MDVIIKLTVPNIIYRFYQEASCHIADSSPEKIMSDALCAYAGLLSRDVAEKYRSVLPSNPEDSAVSEGKQDSSRSR